MAKNCENCGESIVDEDILFCPKCGTYIKRSETKRSYPIKWILLSLIIIVLLIALAVSIYWDDSKIETNLVMVSNSNLDSFNTYSVRLSDNNNNSLADQFISVDLNNENYTLKTDENGIASINLTLSDGSYEINSYFSGDGQYRDSHTSDIIVK